MALTIEYREPEKIDLDTTVVLFKDLLLKHEPLRSYIKHFLSNYFGRKGISLEDGLNSRVTYSVISDILSYPRDKFFVLFTHYCLDVIDTAGKCPNLDTFNYSNCRLTYCEFYRFIMGYLDTEFREIFWSCAEDTLIDDLSDSDSYVSLDFVFECLKKARSDFQYGRFCSLLKKYGFSLTDACNRHTLNVYDAPWELEICEDSISDFVSYSEESEGFESLYKNGYSIILCENYGDYYERLSLAKIIPPSKDMVKLMYGSFKYKKHIMESASSCDDGCEALLELSPNGFDATYIHTINDDEDIELYIADKVDYDSSEGSFDVNNLPICVPKVEFWSQTYGTTHDSKLICKMRDIISPILEKYKQMGFDVDKISWEYQGDPTIDWSKLSNDAVTVYESVSLVDEDTDEPYITVKFIMYVDSSKC